MKDSDFIKLNKTDKLKMEINYDRNIENISRVLMINIKKKMSGYGMSAFFVKVCDGWLRVPDYDCFNFTVEGQYRIKGDFEYGGVVFFGKFTMDYNGSFIY